MSSPISKQPSFMASIYNTLTKPSEKALNGRLVEALNIFSPNENGRAVTSITQNQLHKIDSILNAALKHTIPLNNEKLKELQTHLKNLTANLKDLGSDGIVTVTKPISVIFYAIFGKPDKAETTKSLNQLINSQNPTLRTCLEDSIKANNLPTPTIASPSIFNPTTIISASITDESGAQERLKNLRKVLVTNNLNSCVTAIPAKLAPALKDLATNKIKLDALADPKTLQDYQEKNKLNQEKTELNQTLLSATSILNSCKKTTGFSDETFNTHLTSYQNTITEIAELEEKFPNLKQYD